MANPVGVTFSWVVSPARDSRAKSTSSSCKQLELDLVLFIVQLGATGPPRYTLNFGKETTFLSIYNFFKSF